MWEEALYISDLSFLGRHPLSQCYESSLRNRASLPSPWPASVAHQVFFAAWVRQG